MALLNVYTTVKILNDAAALIERDGWCQRKYRDGRKRCLSMAIADAATGAGANAALEAYDEMCSYVGIEDSAHYPLHRWQDDPGLVEYDIVIALRGAANRIDPEVQR